MTTLSDVQGGAYLDMLRAETLYRQGQPTS
jgi:hypothetical protein